MLPRGSPASFLFIFIQLKKILIPEQYLFELTSSEYRASAMTIRPPQWPKTFVHLQEECLSSGKTSEAEEMVFTISDY